MNKNNNIIDTYKKDLEKQGYDFSKISSEDLYLDFVELSESIIGLTEAEKLFIKIKDDGFYKKLDNKELLYDNSLINVSLVDENRIDFLIKDNLYNSNFSDIWFVNSFSKYIDFIISGNIIKNKQFLMKTFNKKLVRYYIEINKDGKSNNYEVVKDVSIRLLFTDYEEIIDFIINNTETELELYRDILREFYEYFGEYLRELEIELIIKSNKSFTSLYQIYKKINLLNNNIKND